MLQDAATAEVPKQKAAVQQPQSQLAAPLESGPLPGRFNYILSGIQNQADSMSRVGGKPVRSKLGANVCMASPTEGGLTIA